MLTPAHRIHQVIGDEFARLASNIPDSQTDGSSTQAISYVLRLLRERELHGIEHLQRQFKQLDEIIQAIKTTTASSGVDISTELSSLEGNLQEFDEQKPLDTLEEVWRQSLFLVEDAVSKIQSDSEIAGTAKEKLLHNLVNFESTDLVEQLGSESRHTESDTDFKITPDKLTAYLRDRFEDSSIVVKTLHPLSGGFGKETIVFTTVGNALNGEFVMRRDIGDNATLNNDCHYIQKEYEVIKAVRARGYLSPDTLWLDTEHSLLPGSHFIVMRRSPGRQGGSFFGAQTEIPANLTNILAKHTALLHTLPPLTELGDLTESINHQRWNLSRKESTECYLRDWYHYWRNETHTPSPALASLYGWLFDNLPDRQGSPSMLHGDIGFHNILLENEELTVILDWEFAHIGDPAEELGYVKVTTGGALNWDLFMKRYIAAGGEPVDDKTLLFFQIWAYVRNASAANIISTRFLTGKADDLKLCVLPYMHIPHFIRAAQALIKQAA